MVLFGIFVLCRVQRTKKLGNSRYRVRSEDRPIILYNYCHVRRKLRTEKSKAHRLHIRRIQFDLRRNPKRFFVDSKRKCSSILTLMSLNIAAGNCSVKVCDLFAEFFERVYLNGSRESSEDSFLINVDICEDIYEISICIDEVLNLLLRLKLNQSCDELILLLLRNCDEPLLTGHRALTVQLSEGVFPDRCKISSITPNFNCENRSDVSSYCGIAILPTLEKNYSS